MHTLTGQAKETLTAATVVGNVCVAVGSDCLSASELRKTTATAGAGTGMAQTLFVVSHE